MSTRIINHLTVEIDGDGPALLCIHGLGGSSNTWTPLLPSLKNHMVIRPDLPGSARSPLPPDPASPLSIALYVEAMEELLSTLGVTSVDVLAHSMGSIVAQHLAVKNPSLVKSLVLFGPLSAPPDAGRPNIRARAAMARQGLPQMQDIADAIVNGATATQTRLQQPAVVALVRESVMRQAPEAYAQSCEALAAAESADLESLAIPVLLLTGDQDGVAPPANVEVLAARIAGARTVVFEECGHWTPYEKPQRCMQALDTFLASLH